MHVYAYNTKQDGQTAFFRQEALWHTPVQPNASPYGTSDGNIHAGSKSEPWSMGGKTTEWEKEKLPVKKRIRRGGKRGRKNRQKISFSKLSKKRGKWGGGRRSRPF